MQHTVQKLENGQLFVESLQTTKKYGPKGKVLTVTSKENALKILSENELVGVRGGVNAATYSFRQVSDRLKTVGREASGGGVKAILVLNSPLGGIKLKEERFGYPNQFIRELDNLLSIIYIKNNNQLLDQIDVIDNKPGSTIGLWAFQEGNDVVLDHAESLEVEWID